MNFHDGFLDIGDRIGKIDFELRIKRFGKPVRPINRDYTLYDYINNCGRSKKILLLGWNGLKFILFPWLIFYYFLIFKSDVWLGFYCKYNNENACLKKNGLRFGKIPNSSLLCGNSGLGIL